ncbi:MAG: aminotransferase class V-fold PLP-dependent enzyme [Hyphomicrobiaceae bacterium]
MLPSQRHLFDIPRDVTFFNAAAWSPLPKATVDAAKSAVERKARPWLLDGAFAPGEYERCRRAAARLINADPADVALISSVGYGVATAAKLFSPANGSRVIVLENDHTSPVLEWMSRADAQGFTIETVRQPADGDWTTAVLDAIARPGAAPLSLASISSIHWSDGGMLDIDAIGAALKQAGAAFLIDATHGVGVIAMDVTRLDPDFVIWPTYKWLVGPYGRAFLYVAKRHQDGVPLEQTAPGRRDVRAESAVYFADTRYLPDARRFDMGERDHFISMEMASLGMELMSSLGAEAISGRLAMLTRKIAEGLAGLPVIFHAEQLRAPHILSIGFRGGMPETLVSRLAAAKVYAAPRLGRLRISPHVYNDEEDVARLISTLRALIG